MNKSKQSYICVKCNKLNRVAIFWITISQHCTDCTEKKQEDMEFIHYCLNKQTAGLLPSRYFSAMLAVLIIGRTHENIGVNLSSVIHSVN